MQKAQALRFSMDETWIEKDGMDKFGFAESIF